MMKKIGLLIMVLIFYQCQGQFDDSNRFRESETFDNQDLDSQADGPGNPGDVTVSIHNESGVLLLYTVGVLLCIWQVRNSEN